jgi:hypothetical protein
VCVPQHPPNCAPQQPPNCAAPPDPTPPQIPCWTDLPSEIVCLIYQALPKECSASMALMQSCQAFRKVS